MNGVPTIVMFDSGGTLSFVSLPLNKRYRDTPGDRDYPLGRDHR